MNELTKSKRIASPVRGALLRSSQPNRFRLSPENNEPPERLGGSARIIATAVLVLIMLGITACQTPQNIPAHTPGQTPGAIASGDVLKFVFPGAPELNQVQKVRADGKISLPLLGEVLAEDKRLGKFQEELLALYAPQLKNSEVVVSLETSGVPVYVSGSVLKPGKVLLDRQMTVLDAIMECGGFDLEWGDPTRVVLIRNEKGQQITQILDLSPALKGKQTPAFYVKAYDKIFVSN